LRLSTAKSVISGSKVVLSKTADDEIQGIDLSAGTTGSSTLDASAADNASGLLLKGGAGKNTINGGAGTDFIEGGIKADTISGNAGNDLIDAKGGKDTVNGGDGNDTITLTASNQIAGDVINGDAGTNVFEVDTTDAAVIAELDFDNISDVLTINTISSKAATITFSDIAETTSQEVIYTGGTGILTVDNNADSTTTTFKFTGGSAADVLQGSGGNDTFVYATTAAFVSGSAIVDSINGGTGTADTILVNNLDANTFTIAVTDSFARATGVEVIKAAGDSDDVISITLHDNAGAAGINTVDLSLDTDATADNVIDVSAETSSAYNLTGSAGIDAITGGAGVDVIVSGTGADIINGGGTGKHRSP
jgi:Ca2+-binding RTX toxin-like protein